MNLPVGSHVDAWAYYEFGTRSFRDDIRALVLDYLDQAPDGSAVSAKLREQATSSAFPVIPIPLERVTLESKPIYPHHVRDMTRLGLTVQLDKDAEAFTYLGYFPELMAKIGDRVAREIAADLIDRIFFSSAFDEAIAEVGALADRIDALSPDR